MNHKSHLVINKKQSFLREMVCLVLIPIIVPFKMIDKKTGDEGPEL